LFGKNKNKNKNKKYYKRPSIKNYKSGIKI